MGVLRDLRYFGPALGPARGSALLLAKVRKAARKRRVAAELRRGESEEALCRRLGLPVEPRARRDALAELWRPLRVLGRPPDEAAAARRAEKIRAGTQRLFARDVSVGWPPRWDWRWTGHENEPFFRDDVRSTWEVMRLQGILPLAQAGDDDHAGAYLEALRSFHAAHPGPDGPAWESALELGLRLVALAQALPLLAARDAWAARDLLALRMVDRHARWLSADLSLDKVVRGNHLLGELAGLWVAGCLCPAARRAWFAGVAVKDCLEREILAQFHPDGVSVEQSLTYEKFIVEFLAVAAAAGAARGEPFRAETLDRLGAALAHLDAVALPGGGLPRVGDCDSGRGAAWGEEDPHDYAAVRPTLLALFGPGGMRDIEPGAGGSDAAGRSAAIGEGAMAQPPVAAHHFRHGGHAVLRRDDVGDYAFLRGGPFGWGPAGPASHSHCDWLAPVLAMGGDPVLIDPGVFGYRVGAERRDGFRVWSAHGGLSLDPALPPHPDGTFRWRALGPRATLAVRVAEEEWEVAGEVDFAPGGPPLLWRRVLKYNPIARFWRILDSLRGDFDGPPLWAFRFPPGARLDATPDGSEARIVLASGRAVRLRFESEGTTELGEDWVAPSYGARERAPVLRRRPVASAPAKTGSARAAAPADAVTWIGPD